MQFTGLGIGFAAVALLIFFFASRILIVKPWFKAWLRGTFGLALLALALLGGGLAYDISTYKQIPSDKPLMTLIARAEGPQRYQVKILEGDIERNFVLEGDLWQLDVRQLEWKSLADFVGLQSGYRLEALNGRFYSIEQQKTARLAPVKLAQSTYGVDLWQTLHDSKKDFFIVDAKMLQVDYLPIADGVAYSVSFVATGLLATPLNGAAQQALKGWQ